MEYAVINTGGKQYTVYPGSSIQVERLAREEEEHFEINEILLVSKDGKLKVGNPLVDGASVKAQIIENGRGKKITVLKYKPKIRYKKKTGHRQHYTELKITEILSGDEAPVKNQATRTTAKKSSPPKTTTTRTRRKKTDGT